MIVIKQAFTGYPDGKKRVFSAGQEVADLNAEYEATLVSKSLASKASKKGGKNEAE